MGIEQSKNNHDTNPKLNAITGLMSYNSQDSLSLASVIVSD